MTRFTESYTIRDIVSEGWVRGEWFDMVRVHLNSCAVAFVVTCAAILAGVIISPVNSLAPFFIFSLAACYVVLMGFINMPRPFSLIGFLGRGRSNSAGNGLSNAGKGAILPLPSLLFVLRHWFVALRTQYGNSHTVITDAFGIGFLVGLKAFTTDKARLTNAASIGVPSGGTGYAITRGRFIELCDFRERFTAIGTGRKVGLIAGWANPVIPCVITAYGTSVLHVSNIPQITKGCKND